MFLRKRIHYIYLIPPVLCLVCLRSAFCITVFESATVSLLDSFDINKFCSKKALSIRCQFENLVRKFNDVFIFTRTQYIEVFSKVV